MAALAETAMVERKAADIGRQAMSIQVADATQYEQAAHMLMVVAAVRREIAETFDPVIEAAHIAHKKAIAARAQHDDPLKAAESHLKAGMGMWRQIEQQRARAEALRIEAELRKEREALALQQAQEAALARAVEAEQRGETVDLERAVEQELAALPPDFAAPVVVQSAAPKIAGISGRISWKCEVNDLKALVAAVASGKVPLQAIKSDDVFLGQQARSLRSAMNWPGVRVYSEQTMAVRR